jgi:glycerol 3-phosphatase-2
MTTAERSEAAVPGTEPGTEPGTGLRYDALLLDLDGVVYTDDVAVPGAPEALARLHEEGTPVRFVTNNASRTPEQVAERLRGVGVAAEATEVLGSARAAAELLVGRMGLRPGATVAVAGGRGLLDAVAEVGLRPEPVATARERPDALVQGFSPDLAWPDLAAATRWVRAGVPWVATNLDRTIPTADGIAPGNGLLVGCVADAAGRRPDAVAGKPEPHLFVTAARSCEAGAPLVVGDRLDTDIAGGVAAGYDTALVLTGVHGVLDALHAAAPLRPRRVMTTLADLWPGDHARAGEELTALLVQAWRELDDAADQDASEVRERWAERLSPGGG